MGIWYCTREDVMSAQDIKVSAYDTRSIDRAIESASRAVESLLHRIFYPWTGTRYFDTPSWDSYEKVGRIWLAPYDLIAATAVTTQNGAVNIPVNQLDFRPQEGPCFEWVEVNRGTTAAFGSGTTNQRSTAITGLYAYSADEDPAGTTAEAMDATETDMDVSASALIGVGSILRVDSERMVVTEKQWLSTGQTGSLLSSLAANLLTVANGSTFIAGEFLMLDAEMVQVLVVTGNNLIVRRAVQGTTLAAHTTATIFAPRTLIVQRGALGTIAASHLTAAAMFVHRVAGPVNALSIAYAINTRLQEQSGYARVAGSGENERETMGRGIKQAEQAAIIACGRRARTGAI